MMHECMHNDFDFEGKVPGVWQAALHCEKAKLSLTVHTYLYKKSVMNLLQEMGCFFV